MKRKLGATSLGRPGRPIGVLSPKCSTFSGDAPPKGLSGVQMGPGATPFTRMPLPRRFSDRERVKAVMAPLVEEYSRSSFDPLYIVTEVQLTIAAHSFTIANDAVHMKKKIGKKQRK